MQFASGFDLNAWLIRRKIHVRVTELEEQISALISKCSGLEKQKSRLQSEVEVLIIDLEKVKRIKIPSPFYVSKKRN